MLILDAFGASSTSLFWAASALDPLNIRLGVIDATATVTAGKAVILDSSVFVGCANNEPDDGGIELVTLGLEETEAMGFTMVLIVDDKVLEMLTAVSLLPELLLKISFDKTDGDETLLDDPKPSLEVNDVV